MGVASSTGSECRLSDHLYRGETIHVVAQPEFAVQIGSPGMKVPILINRLRWSCFVKVYTVQP
jgi:hypothetical protein